ncbi:MAG: dimethylmenaquinone methyltransferase [Bacteroidetes bacterium SW_4_67_19]|nr:MAG: dimethylmenaquinone methyltransferase [Bacteroidetes bacterium SW_4_67_19]
MSRFRPASVPTFALLLAGLVALSRPAAAQQQYLSPPDTTEVSDERLLELYDGLRVADVSDGMDLVGLRNVGLMDPRIQSLWKDFEKLNHQFHGIALTVRYVPHDRVVSNPMPPDSFKQWKGRWYDEVSPEPFAEKIDPGSVVVIDASGDGAVEEVPVYLNPKKRGRGIRPGRNMLESVNRPIEVGGALVQPGDVIVADGDGVIVVPREHAVEVARHACEVLEGDKAARRRLYERLGRPLDQTVRPGEETDEGDEP